MVVGWRSMAPVALGAALILSGCVPHAGGATPRVPAVLRPGPPWLAEPDWHVVGMTGATPAALEWVPQSPAAVRRTVVRLSRAAVPVVPTLPPAPRGVVFNAYVGPPVLRWRDAQGADGRLEPVAYLERQGAAVSLRYVPGVLAWTEHGRTTYWRDPELAAWFRSGAWRALFHRK